METNEFYNRIDELRDRAGRRGIVTCTGFLTPAEQYALKRYRQGESAVLTGGQPDCERQIAFFLPEWMPPEDFEPSEYIRAVKLQAHFGTPGHRDYLGAALGLGIQREWLGDLRIDGDRAWLFCLPSVTPLLTDELKRAGHVTVSVSECPLSSVPLPERRVKPLSFTVKSPRLDAVAGSMFGLSRSAAAELIRLGAANLNYTPCDKVDAAVSKGDIISLRGHGKGRVTDIGGRSRKDRLFIEAEIYL